MPLDPGSTLGPYAVTAKTGEGGTGDGIGAVISSSTGDVALSAFMVTFFFSAEDDGTFACLARGR